MNMYINSFKMLKENWQKNQVSFFWRKTSHILVCSQLKETWFGHKSYLGNEEIFRRKRWENREKGKREGRNESKGIYWYWERKSLKFVHNLLQRKLTKVPELCMGKAAQQQKRRNWGPAIRGQHLGGLWHPCHWGVDEAQWAQPAEQPALLATQATYTGVNPLV